MCMDKFTFLVKHAKICVQTCTFNVKFVVFLFIVSHFDISVH